MKCPNCNKEVSPEWTVCPFCRFEPKRCSNEGCTSGWLHDEAHFCPECGSQVAGEENMHLKEGIAEFVRQHSKMCTGVEDNSRKETFTVKNVSFTMIKVEAGTFDMGDDDVDSPIHKVTLTQDYYIGETPVTQKLWVAVMHDNPSDEQGDDCPVTDVNWDDCQKFIRKLNQITHLQFRLPTEAEWEFAARGGNESSGYEYAGSDTIDDVAWYEGNTDELQVVGRLKPNELGIYDMSGNVEEWCQDWYDSGYYDNSPQKNPTGSWQGSRRVLRGGNICSEAVWCGVAARDNNVPDTTCSEWCGFRLAL